MLVSLALGAALLPAPSAAPLPVQQSVKLDVSQGQIDEALRQGRRWLLANQAQSHRVGERALVYYAALKAEERLGDDLGEAPVVEDGAMRAFADSFRMQEFTQTYDTACVICFLASYDPQRYYPDIERATQALIQFQKSNGGFGYPSGEDLSNTQYGALGLWKAGTVGVPIPARVWSALGERVLELQNKDGGFGYVKGSSSSVNMTTAGVGTLAICETALRRLDSLSETKSKRLHAARADGNQWLEDRVPPREQRLRAWPMYGLYGLERLGAWSGLHKLGAHDWYQRGSESIVPMQREDGQWGSAVDTAFAVLFLSRATSDDRPGIAVTSSGEDRGSNAMVTKSERNPEAFARLRVDGNGPSFRFGVESWNWAALRPYEWPKERGRGPRIRYVEYLINGQVVRVQLADEVGPLLNRRFRTMLWAPEKGPLRLTMRVHLELPKGKPKDEQGNPLKPMIELGPLEFVALRALEVPKVGHGYAIEDASLVAARPTVRASSRISTQRGLMEGKHDARSAADGDLRTAWIARTSDTKRTWSARLPRPVRADRLTVYPAVPIRDGRALAQPKLIEVTINGSQRQVIVLAGDGSQARVRLDPPVLVERLELRIVTLQQPVEGELAPFGLAEVVLRAAGE